MSRRPSIAPAAASGAGLSLEQVADVLKALGHPLRLRLIALLGEGPSSVGALASRVGAAQSITSQQLRILRMSGLVAAKRANGQAIYQIIEPRLHKLLKCMGLSDIDERPPESRGREVRS
jgi:ArsR family transcriptional regulator